MTATGTRQTLQERAKAAVAATDKKNEAHAKEQRERETKTLRDGMILDLVQNLGVEIPRERVAVAIENPTSYEPRQIATTVIDGLTFTYRRRSGPSFHGPRLALLRPCEKRDDCGVPVESDGINNIEDLGRILEEKPEHTECQVEYEERDRRSEESRAAPPPRTAGEKFLDALRDYITAEIPEF